MFSVRRTTLSAPQAREVEAIRAQAQASVSLVRNGDDFRVQRRVIAPDRLKSDLLQLPVAAMLRSLGAKERPGVPELDRQCALVESVLDDRPHDSRRPLRPQRQGPPSAIKKGVHLLADHVRAFAHTPHEQRRVFEHRQFDVSIAGASRRMRQRLPHREKRRRSRREILRDSFGCLKFDHAHHPRFGACASCPEPAAFRNGFDARSCPIVVWGP